MPTSMALPQAAGWPGAADARRSRISRRRVAAAALLCWALAAGGVEVGEYEDGDVAAETVVPDKVGVEVHLSKKERATLKKLDCSMCKTIVAEMHTEVSKHKMTQKGVGSESHVWETANAICLALLQKYRINVTGPALERSGEDEDDQMAALAGGGPDAMRNMLVLKMGCQLWVEDYGGDMSGFIYKVVKADSHTPETAAQEFCVKRANLCGKGRKEKQQKVKEKDRERRQEREVGIKKQEAEEAQKKEKDPFAALPEDSKLGLQHMLEMARDDPLHYLDDDAKVRVQQARADLRCDVCHTMLEDVLSQVAKRPKSMQREHDILPFIEGACDGGKDLSVPSYFGVEPPPLPPAWADEVRPQLPKASKTYRLRPFPKKARKQRRAWRKTTKEAGHKPPTGGESEGDMMLSMTCRDILEPAKMTEALYTNLAACGAAPGAPCRAAQLAAEAVCKASSGSRCTYDAADQMPGAVASREEL